MLRFPRHLIEADLLKMRRRFAVFVAVVAVMGFGVMTAGAHAAQVKVGGIYSDLHQNQESADLVGTELFVVATEDGWSVFYQHWEGGGDRPIVVPATVEGDRLSFDIPASYGGGGHYEGRLSATAFEGLVHFRDGKGHAQQQQLNLKRTKSYWE